MSRTPSISDIASVVSAVSTTGQLLVLLMATYLAYLTFKNWRAQIVFSRTLECGGNVIKSFNRFCHVFDAVSAASELADIALPSEVNSPSYWDAYDRLQKLSEYYLRILPELVEAKLDLETQHSMAKRFLKGLPSLSSIENAMLVARGAERASSNALHIIKIINDVKRNVSAIKHNALASEFDEKVLGFLNDLTAVDAIARGTETKNQLTKFGKDIEDAIDDAVGS